MDFKQLVANDLDKVFFDTGYFADVAKVNDVDVTVIFEKDYAVVDGMEVVSYQPAFSCPTAVSESFKRGDSFKFEGVTYTITQPNRENDVSVFLLERS